MTPAISRERWQHIKHVVNEALEADTEARTQLLQQSCAEDFALRIGAEALLSVTRKLPEQPLAPDEWQRIEQLFQAALELDADQRAAYLNEACQGDENLRLEVESLLIYQNAAGGLIQGAVYEAADLLPHHEKARFTPGMTLNKRYRIIGLLGKGGMGEVYRADDLTLNQPVALKFLTEKLARDKAMLTRFRSEVAMAHRVTHPNVCRVHDIGEVITSAGVLPFLSMEYVDGEDLSSLLRRIGRLPSDKAVEIAQQLCEGLAAAHEAGVLHRDLKPANVMIDGRGRVRITDFGLAGFAEQITGQEVFAGTPAYMSPEQFAGKEVTTKSDIYALGLVLYEVFTGKRVFEAGSLDELRRMHESSAPTNPSSWVKDLDPLVERVILRCLEKDPGRRLASAKQVADSLPGGDPLAAALALGETPSPEMVAAAGQKTGMTPKYAVACLVAIIVGFIVHVALRDRTSPFPSLLREHSPEELTHKAHDLARQFGYTERPADSAFGFQSEWEYQEYVSQNIALDKQREQFTKVMAPISYWYRQSPQYLKSWIDGWVYDSDPPPNTSGMIGVWLDLQGRLTRFEAVPPQVDQATDVPPPPDWKPLFSAAGLDPASFVSAPSQWMPLAGFDARMAWTGTHPTQPQLPLRIEAAAYRGKPVYFHLIWPWTSPARMPAHQTSMGQQIGGALIIVAFCALILGALLLVRYNFRHNRGDRRGAFRMATFIFTAQIGTWLFGAHHGPTFDILIGFFLHAVSPALLSAGFAWSFYIALEPYVRRHWPVVLISWNRLLSGSLRDPLVNRDLLIAILFAVVGRQTIGLLRSLFFNWDFGNMSNFARDALPGLRFLIASGFSSLSYLTMATLIFLFLLFVLRTLTRRQWLTATIFISLGCLLGLQQSPSPLVGALFNGLNFLLIIVIMLRFGFFAFAVYAVVSGFLSYPMTLHFSAWYTNSALLLAGVILALAIYAFRMSLGGQKVFSGKLLEE